MLLYYVQIKDRHDPGINIRERGWGALRPLAGILGGRTP